MMMIKSTSWALLVASVGSSNGEAPQLPFRAPRALDTTSTANVTLEALIDQAIDCNKDLPPLDFVIVEGIAVNTAVEDDIRANVAILGIDVNARLVSKDERNDRVDKGDFHLAFSESYGPPYDPHGYARGWIDGSGGDGHHAAFAGIDREYLYNLIRDVAQEEDRETRNAKWKDIHEYYHKEAVMLPLWGKDVPTLMNTRLAGWVAGLQQFDYPAHRLVPLQGNLSTVTIAPGGQTGLFRSVGRLDPHTYRPNEFFANNWVYEGLVQYGQGGQVLPALARSWDLVDTQGEEGQTYTFLLRENVTFHDGTPWNCGAAKMNFDHVFAGDLVTPDWHGWYGVPGVVKEWHCDNDGEGGFEFVLTTKSKYAPLLQELTYIRPLRMLSPASFKGDPLTANSCHEGWGVIESTDPSVRPDVTCAGIGTNVSGTGPWTLTSRVQSELVDGETTETVDDEVIFSRNEAYWGTVPAFETLKVVRYETSEDVKSALLEGSLDVVWGSGVLTDADIIEIRDSNEYQDTIDVFLSQEMQNEVVLLNSGKPPLDDVEVRKIVIHAINKAMIANKELGGRRKVVDNVFPLDAPYCNVDLTPRWDYDIEKAALLSCLGKEEEPASTNQVNTANDNVESNTLALALGLGLGIPCAILLVASYYFFNRSKKLELQLESKPGATDA